MGDVIAACHFELAGVNVLEPEEHILPISVFDFCCHTDYSWIVVLPINALFRSQFSRNLHQMWQKGNMQCNMCIIDMFSIFFLHKIDVCMPSTKKSIKNIVDEKETIFCASVYARSKARGSS